MSAPDRDAGLADRIAAALRQERRRELEAAAHPPILRPIAMVPDWLFGPRHREMDARRTREREAIAADDARQPDACPTCGRVR